MPTVPAPRQALFALSRGSLPGRPEPEDPAQAQLSSTSDAQDKGAETEGTISYRWVN